MNVELAPAAAPQDERAQPALEMSKIATPEARSIDQVCQQLAVDPRQTLKTLLVEGDSDSTDGNIADNKLVALVLRGDHSLNPIKAANIEGVANPLVLASAERITAAMGAQPGSEAR